MSALASGFILDKAFAGRPVVHKSSVLDACRPRSQRSQVRPCREEVLVHLVNGIPDGILIVPGQGTSNSVPSIAKSLRNWRGHASQPKQVSQSDQDHRFENPPVRQTMLGDIEEGQTMPYSYWNVFGEGKKSEDLLQGRDDRGGMRITSLERDARQPTGELPGEGPSTGEQLVVAILRTHDLALLLQVPEERAEAMESSWISTFQSVEDRPSEGGEFATMTFEEGTARIMQLVIEPGLDTEPEQACKADENEENGIDSLLIADSEIEREPLDDLVPLPSAESTAGLAVHELERLGRSRSGEEALDREAIGFEGGLDLPAAPILVLELVKADTTLEDRCVSKDMLCDPELSGDRQGGNRVPEGFGQETFACSLTTLA